MRRSGRQVGKVLMEEGREGGREGRKGKRGRYAEMDSEEEEEEEEEEEKMGSRKRKGKKEKNKARRGNIERGRLVGEKKKDLEIWCFNDKDREEEERTTQGEDEEEEGKEEEEEEEFPLLYEYLSHKRQRLLKVRREGGREGGRGVWMEYRLMLTHSFPFPLSSLSSLSLPPFIPPSVDALLRLPPSPCSPSPSISSQANIIIIIIIISSSSRACRRREGWTARTTQSPPPSEIGRGREGGRGGDDCTATAAGANATTAGGGAAGAGAGAGEAEAGAATAAAGTGAAEAWMEEGGGGARVFP